jgi:hypothetical protein
VWREWVQCETAMKGAARKMCIEFAELKIFAKAVLEDRENRFVVCIFRTSQCTP